jgi:O-antigen ligase
VVPWAHNLYLEVLAEQGIVGLAALGFLLARGWSQARRIQRTADNEARIFATAALGGLLGLCFAGMIELSLLRHWVVITLFVILGVIAKLCVAQMNRGNCNGHVNR